VLRVEKIADRRFDVRMSESEPVAEKTA